MAGQALSQAEDYNSQLLQEVDNYNSMTNVPNIATYVKPGVVTINITDKDGHQIDQGSGFFINNHDIITCYHLINHTNLHNITIQGYVPYGYLNNNKPYFVPPDIYSLGIIYPVNISEIDEECIRK